MTKETKIGLLVGLAFIILFGIILSEKGTSRQQFSTPSMSAYHPLVEIVPPRDNNPPQMAKASRNIVDKIKLAQNINSNTRKQSDKIQDKTNINPKNENTNNQNSNQLDQEFKKLIPIKSTRALTKQIPASAPTIPQTTARPKPIKQSEKLAKNTDNTPKTTNIIGTHLVAKGETLIGICKKYYPGNAYKMIKKVMALNNIQKPERLRAGQTLKLPADNSFAKSNNVTNQPTPKSLLQPVRNPQIAAIINIKPTKLAIENSPKNKNKISSFKTYTVKSNDSLCKIAKKFYGSEQEWKIIYQYNRDILKNPDKLRSGIRLKLPQNEKLAVAGNNIAE